MDIVRECWNKDVAGTHMWVLYQKMKRLSNTLNDWSKKEHGDIFAMVKDYVERVKVAEEEVVKNNRHQQIKFIVY